MFTRNVMSHAYSKNLQGRLSNFLRNFSSITTHNQQEPARIEKSLNSVQLIGRVGADPQKKGTEQHPVVVFSIATHNNYRYDTGEFLQRTDWHRVVCFKPGLRETVMKYLKKGQRIYVTGCLTYGEITGQDGSKKPSTSISADDIIFLNSVSG